MFLELKKIGKHTLIYGSGLFISKAIGFFLIPLYTHYLTPSDYGTLELLDLTGYMLAYFIAIGMSDAVLRFYHVYETPQEKNSILSTALVFNVILGVLLLAALFPFHTLISLYLLGTEKSSYLVALLSISVLMGVILDLEKTVLRAQQRSITYTITSLGFTLLAVTLNIAFVAVMQYGVAGIYYSSIITGSILITYLSFRLLRETGLTVNPARLKEMLKYSLPFVPVGVLSFVLMWSDRYILRMFHGTDIVGQYALGYKMGMMVVFLVVTPFTLFWNSYIFEIQKRQDAGFLYSRITTYYILMLLFVGLAISVFAYELITVMAPPSYLPAYAVIPLITLAMILMTSDTVFQVGLLIKGKSTWLPIAKGIAASVSVSLNFLLVPGYGIIGSAIASVIAFALYSAIILSLSQRVYKIHFEYKRLLKIVGAVFCVYIASMFIPTDNLLFSIMVKSLLLLLFPFILIITGFMTNDEIAFLKRSSIALRKTPNT